MVTTRQRSASDDGHRASIRPAWWMVAAAVVVVAALAILLGPRPVDLPERQSGDAALAEQVREALETREGTGAVAVALVEQDSIRIAGLGDSGDPARPQVDADSVFEIGSITKALNGMLLSALSADGVVSPATRVREVVGDGAMASSAVGDVTLEQLSQHRSGLSALAYGGPLGVVRSLLADFRGSNPYPDWSVDRLLAAAADQSTDGRGEYAYSNLGAAVLGHTLARETGEDYADLLRARVLAPLELNATTVATSQDALPRPRVRATSYAGQARDPWFSTGYLPAGTGVWSTPRDMAQLLQAMIDGSAPGAGAATPTARIGEDRQIGLGWFTSILDGRAVTWHNGGTGGFRSWIGYDRTAGHGVVVLSASDRDVDQLGQHLLGVAPAPRDRGWTAPDGQDLLILGLAVFACIVAINGVRQVRSGRAAQRVDVIGGAATVAVLLVVAWRRGPWLQTSWLLWSLVAAVAVVAVVAQCWYARRLPWTKTERRWRWIAGAVVNVVIAVVFVVWIV